MIDKMNPKLFATLHRGMNHQEWSIPAAGDALNRDKSALDNPQADVATIITFERLPESKTLSDMLASYDPKIHGVEVMAFSPVGKEIL